MTFAAETTKASWLRPPVQLAIALGGLIATLAAFLRALDVAARLAQTSDSAQGLVVGHAVRGGNLLLSGWHFPFDDFYFSDTIPYAVLEWMLDSQSRLLVLVPAVVYGLFVAAAILACVRRSQAPARSAASLCIVAIFFAAPVWIGSWNPLFFSDMHVAPTLGAFVALALCAKLSGNRVSAGWLFGAAAALVLIGATVASDPYAIIFAFAPALAVLAADAIIARRAAGALSVVALGIAAGLALPRAIALGGGFTTEKDVLFGVVAMPLFPRNLTALLGGLLRIFGIAVQGSWYSPRVILVLALRGFAFATAAAAIIQTLRNAAGRNRPALLDRCLCAGILAVLFACAASAQFAKGIVPGQVWEGGPPMRYLVPVYLFGAVLAARRIPDLLAVLPARAKHLGGFALLLLAAITLLSGNRLSGVDDAPLWTTDNPSARLARCLESHGFSQGVGEYWSANLVTAVSGNAVQVRSIVPDRGRLIPYVWVQDARGFAQSPQFVIWREPNKTGITSALVHATYTVCSTAKIAGYRVAVLPRIGRGCPSEAGLRRFSAT